MKRLVLFLFITGCLAYPSLAQDHRLIDSLQTDFLTGRHDTIKSKILYELSQAYLKNSPDTAMAYACQNLVLSGKTGYKKGIGLAYISMGIISFSRGDYSKAFELQKKALKIMKEIGNKQGIADSYGAIGTIYSFQGNYPEALRCFSEALTIHEETGNKPGIAGLYFDMGIMYHFQGNNAEALRNFKNALSLFEKMGDKERIADCYYNIGTVYSDMGNYPEALKSFNTVLKIETETGNTSGQALGLFAIGKVYQQQGNNAEALKNLFASMEISEALANNDYLSACYVSIGKIYIKQGNYYEARQYLNKSLSLAKVIGVKDNVILSYLGLAQLDSAQGNYKMAFEHYKQYVSIRDSVHNEENKQKLTQQQMQYESDKTEAVSKAEQKNNAFGLINETLSEKELQKQKLVRNGFIGGFLLVCIFAFIFFRQRTRIIKEKRIVDTEKKRSEELLLNILPFEVAEEIKKTGHCQAKTFSMVTVMFMDFKDFTRVSEKVSAELLVDEINACFSAFDAIIQKYKVEKIKTVGDAYICAGGLPVLNFTHAFDIVSAAIEIRDFMIARKKEKEDKNEIPFELRIGIHTGPVVAGIVGLKKFQYDIWGDTVNLAARMEQHSDAGRINISSSTYALVKDKFNCTYRGKVEAKNKGQIDMYFVDSLSLQE
ncbi:MAG TPA: adenylate/guanylate cyclase domain-containing protein [Bacteroidales bacterium]|nr:adenylate/guanylate cyclase domain-containing protein [Bacteroidales bacterium]